VEFVTGLKCVFCDGVFPVRRYHTCPRCGIHGILDVQYDYRGLARRLTRRTLAARGDLSQWRYRELPPIRAASAMRR
jgi:threonine synthase